MRLAAWTGHEFFGWSKIIFRKRTGIELTIVTEDLFPRVNIAQGDRSGPRLFKSIGDIRVVHESRIISAQNPEVHLGGKIRIFSDVELRGRRKTHEFFFCVADVEFAKSRYWQE